MGHFADIFDFGVEFGINGGGAGWAAQRNALGAFAGKGGAGALADQVAFELSGQSKGECENLAFEVVGKLADWVQVAI